MKVDFSTAILDLTGKPLVENENPITLGSISCTALTALAPDESQLAAATKVSRFRLALIASTGGEQDITPEQLVELKDLVGKLFAPLVVGRVYEILEIASK